MLLLALPIYPNLGAFKYPILGGSDPKESIYFGAPEDISPYGNLNQWPSEEILPRWRSTMEEDYRAILYLGKRVLSLIALALNVNEDFFEKVGAFNPPGTLLRPMHYPGRDVFRSKSRLCCGMLEELL
ncbi:hypothetical protein R3W88_021457 [Solanum pinnatisectum]|uniref:Uncharacterized protein n=1 Tax=Solanum pinnatisectum TaxID=50273 RepID=A0AAV9LRV8_9SOLN|nr:hypothetical protein R3W88_021457 [Solanum pinnatisectum]